MLHFAAAHVEEADGRYDEAFRHYGAANKLVGHAFDIDTFSTTVDTICELFNGEFLRERKSFGVESPLPVFVAGLPRSGKSLIERYLGGHPLIEGAGEIGLGLIESVDVVAKLENAGLPDSYASLLTGLTRERSEELSARYLNELRRYSSKAKRIVNSMPGNFHNIGLLSLLLPGARFIFVRRSPLDTCVSCFMKNFQNAHPYTNKLTVMGGYYRHYRRLMDHWRTVVPDRILEVSYENFVSDPQSELHRLVDFLGLQDTGGLIGDNGEPVTWSQETELTHGPIDQSHVGIWRKYRTHLDPLIEALGDLADAEAMSS